MIALRPCPDHLSFALMAPHGCPDPFRVGNTENTPRLRAQVNPPSYASLA